MPVNGHPALGEADAANVSEALWSQWRGTLQRHGLGHEMLGRFAASLQDLPRALWRAPLGVYAGLSLAEIRSLKAHGEKRVGAVLAIFANLHGILSRAEACPHLTAKIVPSFVTRIESWCSSLGGGLRGSRCLWWWGCAVSLVAGCAVSTTRYGRGRPRNCVNRGSRCCSNSC